MEHVILSHKFPLLSLIVLLHASPNVQSYIRYLKTNVDDFMHEDYCHLLGSSFLKPPPKKLQGKEGSAWCRCPKR